MSCKAKRRRETGNPGETFFDFRLILRKASPAGMLEGTPEIFLKESPRADDEARWQASSE